MSELYWDVGGGHWIHEVLRDGEVIILEDGTKWEITVLDRIQTMLWLPTTDIVVSDGDDPVYPYVFTNKDGNESAAARLVGTS